MDFLKSPALTYIGAVIAVLAMVSGVFEWFDPQIAWSIAGMFGFGSVASLRVFIDSSGWKTYALTGIPIVLGALTLAGVTTVESYQALMAVFAPLTGATIQQAQSKAKMRLAA